MLEQTCLQPATSKVSCYYLALHCQCLTVRASISAVSTARFPGDLLPRVLGSQIGATLLLALLNNARNQMGESLLLRADGPGRPLWVKEFSLLLDTLAGKLGHLLAHAVVRCHIIALRA